MLKKQKTQNTNKGITLIALVITIIVMLILVAVTITIAVNGGLFEYASNAGKEMNEATKLEQELGSGRIKVGNTWYDSPQDVADGKPSANHGKEEEGEQPDVQEPEEEVTSISVENLTIKHTEEGQLTITGVPSEKLGEVTYSSNNNSVATVNTDGKVTGVAPGRATITVTYKTLSETCTVTVEPKVTSITLSESAITLKQGEEYQISVITAPTQITEGYTIQSSSPSCAEVSRNGNIITIKATYDGTNRQTDLTVSYGDVSAICRVDVPIDEPSGD